VNPNAVRLFILELLLIRLVEHLTCKSRRSADGLSGQPTKSATPYFTITVSAAVDSSSHETADRHSPVVERGATRPCQSNSESIMSAKPVSPLSRASDLPIQNDDLMGPVVDSLGAMSRTLDRAAGDFGHGENVERRLLKLSSG
jgi:hypothetical protein